LLAQLLALNGGYTNLPLFQASVDTVGNMIPSIDSCATVGRLELFAEEATRSMDSVQLNVSLLDMKIPRKKYPLYFTLSRGRAWSHLPSLWDTDPILIYRSDRVSDWPDFVIRQDKLFKGDIWRPIYFSLYDGRDNVICVSQFTSYDILHRVDDEDAFGRSVVLHLFDSSNDFFGKVKISARDIIHEYSFLDYVTAGLEVSVMACIDFTRSNGDPRQASSHHAFDIGANEFGANNEYAKVLESVLGILEQYDSDKLIPVYGFGAKLPPGGTSVSHCFSLSGDFFHPEVKGVTGALEAYRNALGVVSLHGPTELAPVFRLAQQFATNPTSRMTYYIVLIVTDGGDIVDFRDTIDEIVALAELPVSIIIVGVGDSDTGFEQLKKLDADDTPLFSTTTGRTIERDIIQFVQFSDYKGKPLHDLAMATLDEVPREVLGYFKSRQIFPLPAETRKFTGFTRSEHATSESSESSGFGAFLKTAREDLIEIVTRQGYDHDIISDVISTYGLLEPTPLHAIDVMFHLKKMKADPGNLKPSVTGIIPISQRLCVKDTLALDRKTPSRKSQVRLGGKSKSKTITHCGICFTNEIDVKLEPCGHEVICRECVEKLSPVCPLCRGVVNSVVDIIRAGDVD
jgi:hypothetical protein